MDRNRPLTKTDNFWLAIPTPAAGKSLRGGRITPGEWERRRGLRPDLARDAARALDAVPGRIVANWVEGRL